MILIIARKQTGPIVIRRRRKRKLHLIITQKCANEVKVNKIEALIIKVC